MEHLKVLVPIKVINNNKRQQQQTPKDKRQQKAKKQQTTQNDTRQQKKNNVFTTSLVHFVKSNTSGGAFESHYKGFMFPVFVPGCGKLVCPKICEKMAENEPANLKITYPFSHNHGSGKSP